MAIIINIDVMLAKRKMSVTELADKVGITMANISVLKNGKAKAIRALSQKSDLARGRTVLVCVGSCYFVDRPWFSGQKNDPRSHTN